MWKVILEHDKGLHWLVELNRQLSIYIFFIVPVLRLSFNFLCIYAFIHLFLVSTGLQIQNLWTQMVVCLLISSRCLHMKCLIQFSPVLWESVRSLLTATKRKVFRDSSFLRFEAAERVCWFFCSVFIHLKYHWYSQMWLLFTEIVWPVYKHIWNLSSGFFFSGHRH